MFTTPCFIRKNTAELRKKLEKFGYSYVPNGYDEWFIPINELSCLETFNDCNCYMGRSGLWSTSIIDCGENEELFLALAALRDDKPDYQWYVWDDENDKGDKFKQYVPEEPWQDWWWFEVHKATPEELIEYFNGKN
jgi:hypothetical protein